MDCQHVHDSVASCDPGENAEPEKRATRHAAISNTATINGKADSIAVIIPKSSVCGDGASTEWADRCI
jgi:hypothetical protein